LRWLSGGTDSFAIGVPKAQEGFAAAGRPLAAAPFDRLPIAVAYRPKENKERPSVLCLALRAHIVFFDFFTTSKALEKLKKVPAGTKPVFGGHQNLPLPFKRNVAGEAPEHAI
jgi:hypothetical protein